MIPYRIYRLDVTDHIEAVVEADCSSDQEALATARRVAGTDATVEVWQLDRCLGKVHAEV